MSWIFFLKLLSFAILGYFLYVNVFYLFIFCLSSVGMLRHRLRTRFSTPHEILKARLTPPVSILVPAHNEEKTIVASVRSLLNLEYGEYEIIVINDDSKDATLAALDKEFKLRKTMRTYHPRIASKPIRAVYRSRKVPNLIVIDKENGGKADSLNAGINVSTYPLICSIDADSVLEKHSLLQTVQPFMEAYTQVAATGGLVRIANGCIIEKGEVISAKTSGQWLVDFQIVEYFRAFLSGRIGLSMMNALLVISGAFGLFKKETVIQAGGYRADVVGEDMELVVRLHHENRRKGIPCIIRFIPDPVCWTEAPSAWKILSRQRNRWQRGLAESLSTHISMLLNPRYGALGLIAMPYYVFIEGLSPVVELLGYMYFTAHLMHGAVNLKALFAFFMLSAGFGMILSLLALLIEEITYRRYPRIKDLLRLVAAAILENLGYRQAMSWVRAKGLMDWILGRKSWGAMERTGATGK